MSTESLTNHRSAATPPKAPSSDAPPWHGLPLATARRFYQLCAAEIAEVVAEAGLTTLQYGALLYLSKRAGARGVEQNSLATGLDVDRNSASLLVEQLVRNGLVERRVNGADRRARLLSPTPKGEKLCVRLHPAHLAANERTLAPLTPRERKVFFDLLIRVIEADRVDAAPRAGRRKRGTRLSPSAKA